VLAGVVASVEPSSPPQATSASAAATPIPHQIRRTRRFYSRPVAKVSQASTLASR